MYTVITNKNNEAENFTFQVFVFFLENNNISATLTKLS